MSSVGADDLMSVLSGLAQQMLSARFEPTTIFKGEYSSQPGRNPSKSILILPKSTQRVLDSPSRWLPSLTKYHGYAVSRHWRRTSNFFSTSFSEFTSIDSFYWFLFKWPGHLGIYKRMTEEALIRFKSQSPTISSIPPAYWIWRHGRRAKAVEHINTRQGMTDNYKKERHAFLKDCIDYNVCPSLFTAQVVRSENPLDDLLTLSSSPRISPEDVTRESSRSQRTSLLIRIVELALSSGHDYRPIFKSMPESISLFKSLRFDHNNHHFPLFPLICWFCSNLDRVPIPRSVPECNSINKARLYFEDLVFPADRQCLMKWYTEEWCLDYPSHRMLIDDEDSCVETHRTFKETDGAIDIVANWDGLGLSKNAEMTLKALCAIGMTAQRYHPHRGYIDTGIEIRTPSQVIFHVNADDCVELALEQLSIGRFRNSRPRLIGFFLWELESVPIAHELGCELVDIIMVPSLFLMNSYSNYKNKVYLSGKAVEIPSSASMVELPPEARFISKYKKIFLLIFDAGSGVERKNPYLAVKSFEHLYADRSDICLIVKASQPPENHWGDPFDQYNRVKSICDAHKNILLIERRLSDSEIFALIHKSNIIVSSHRAEGFGYLLSYAILARKQLVATDYSGISTELRNFKLPWYPVRYTLIPPPNSKFFQEMADAFWADASLSDMKRQLMTALAESGSWGSIVEANRSSFELFEEHYSLHQYSNCLQGILNLSLSVHKETEYQEDLIHEVPNGEGQGASYSSRTSIGRGRHPLPSYLRKNSLELNEQEICADSLTLEVYQAKEDIVYLTYRTSALETTIDDLESSIIKMKEKLFWLRSQRKILLSYLRFSLGLVIRAQAIIARLTAKNQDPS